MILRIYVVLTWMCDKNKISIACDIMGSHKINIAIMTMITMMTTWCVQMCGINSSVVHFNGKTYDREEGNMTRRVRFKLGKHVWDI